MKLEVLEVKVNGKDSSVEEFLGNLNDKARLALSHILSLEINGVQAKILDNYSPITFLETIELDTDIYKYYINNTDYRSGENYIFCSVDNTRFYITCKSHVVEVLKSNKIVDALQNISFKLKNGNLTNTEIKDSKKMIKELSSIIGTWI